MITDRQNRHLDQEEEKEGNHVRFYGSKPGEQLIKLIAPTDDDKERFDVAAGRV